MHKRKGDSLILYFGGAYNGKLEYVKEKYNLTDKDIFYCNKDNIDFNKKVISGLDKFILFNALNGNESLEYIKNNIENLRDKIIICDEISNGIVPIKKEERFWREEVGKVLRYLVSNSDEVYKIFFGIPKRLKHE